MELEFRRLEALPRLAWLAGVDTAASRVTLYHGRCVETGRQWFAEGVWNGDFAAGGIAGADFVFGSGGGLDGEGITFVSCSATTDYLYYRAQDAQVTVSNSLPMLLAWLDDRLVATHTGYAGINDSIRQGIDAYQPVIPTRNGAIRRLIWRNLRVTADTGEVIDKPPSPRIDSYADYHACLQENLGLLLANARDSRRTCPMKVFSTQSRGYDSTALNALAAPFGVDRTFTCPDSKEKGTFYFEGRGETRSDDGTEICARLGLACTPIDRLSIREGFDDEYLYYAALHKNSDMNLRQIHAHVDDAAVLLTGMLGEMWSTHRSAGPKRQHLVDDTLKRWYLPGNGLAEIRLHRGIVQLAVPFIGARQRPAIDRITGSEAMAPWHLENDYDRPVARRIAEEAGVPREMFGQEKLAAIVDFPMPSLPFGRELRREYYRFLRRHRLLSRAGTMLYPLVLRINNYICWKQPQHLLEDHRNHRVLYSLGRLYQRLTGRKMRIRRLWTRLDGSLYCHCVNRTADDYLQMRAASPAGGDRVDRKR